VIVGNDAILPSSAAPTTPNPTPCTKVVRVVHGPKNKKMLKPVDEPSWLQNDASDTVDWEDPNTSTQKRIADTGSAYEEAKKVHAEM
jgi:hypothetical protein